MQLEWKKFHLELKYYAIRVHIEKKSWNCDGKGFLKTSAYISLKNICLPKKPTGYFSGSLCGKQGSRDSLLANGKKAEKQLS